MKYRQNKRQTEEFRMMKWETRLKIINELSTDKRFLEAKAANVGSGNFAKRETQTKNQSWCLMFTISEI